MTRRETLLTIAFATWGLAIGISLAAIWHRPAPADQLPGFATAQGFDAHAPFRFVVGIALRALAALAVVLLVIGAVVLAVLGFIAIFDPVPGDEAALGAGAAALAAMIPVLLRFIRTGTTEAPAGGA